MKYIRKSVRAKLSKLVGIFSALVGGASAHADTERLSSQAAHYEAQIRQFDLYLTAEQEQELLDILDELEIEEVRHDEMNRASVPREEICYFPGK